MTRNGQAIAVIGTGSIGMRHLQVLRQLGGVRVIAVPARQTRRQELEAAGFSTADDLEGAARWGATSCIVSTETGRHVADALAALERGLAVLVEKPLAANAQAARRLTEQAAATLQHLFVGCVLRFSESLRMVRESLAEIGRVHAVRIECQSYLPEWRPQRDYRASYSARPDEGGVLRDLIHEIDYAGWLFGWPESVQGRLRNTGWLDIEAEEIAEVTWETPSGAIVSIGLNYLSRPSRRHMRACGERGTIEWDGIANTVTVALVGSPATTRTASQPYDQMFAEQDQAFLDAARGHRNPRLATGTDGVMALAVCDAVRRASASRQEESVHLPLGVSSRA